MLKPLSFSFLLLLGSFSPALAQQDKTLTVYTSRKEELIRPLFDRFTQQTGIRIEMLNDESAKLIARLESEGKDSPADVLMPADVANMELAAARGLLAPLQSDVLSRNIPANMRDAQNRWFGLGMRARVIVYNKEKVKPSQLSTYEDLADAKWKGQLLVRSSSHPYNQSLIAAMVAQDGAEKTESWVKGVMANLARAPQGGDRDQIKAIAAGEGSIAIANSYYYARMLNSQVPEEKEAAQKTAIFFPNQKAAKGEMQGAHINVSGAGVVAASDLPKEAQQFVEFLSTPEAQTIYAEGNQEYPVNPAVKPSATLQSLGSFKPDSTPLQALGAHMQEAIRIADRSGWK